MVLWGLLAGFGHGATLYHSVQRTLLLPIWNSSDEPTDGFFLDLCVFISNNPTEPKEEETLTLSVGVTCASSTTTSDPSLSGPHIPVSACTNCIAREAKRIERKKAARVRPHLKNDSSESEEEGAIFFRAQEREATTTAAASLRAARFGSGGGVATGVGMTAGISGVEEEGTGIVVFNCPEVNEFTDGRAVLPVRVTCYCRHHREKVGFMYVSPHLSFFLASSLWKIADYLSGLPGS